MFDEKHTLEVGDRIECTIGTSWKRIDVVTRVTKTMAICEEGKVRYQRVVGISTIQPIPYRSTTITYRLLPKE